MARKHKKGDSPSVSVVVIGGGFAGVACTKELAKHGIGVTLLDRNNYHQFQPMLYQVATAQLAPSDIARPLRAVFRKEPVVNVKLADVTAVDPVGKTVTCADGTSYSGDYLVLAMGSRPNFFNTPGAEEHAFPLYALADAERLRSRLLAIFEDADRRPELVQQGALNFVIVGAGATGVETAGALADAINEVVSERLNDLAVDDARVLLIDPAPVVLAPFSNSAHEYAAKALTKLGVELKLGVSVTSIDADKVTLSDGSEVKTRCVVWAGGIQAAGLAERAGVPQGRGGRIDVNNDLTIDGFPGVYAVGDVANLAGADGQPFPQLGSVALQAGKCVADNILADIDGKDHHNFRYHDKGIMAMIGRDAAIAEMGEHRHELHGPVAFAAWLGVHAWLLSGVRQRIDAFVSWGWDYFSKTRGPAVLDRPDAAQIDWGDDEDENEDQDAMTP
jgi:NADH dehydrogenase